MKKLLNLLLLALLSMLICSCGDDDPASSDPLFQFSIDWDTEFEQLAMDSFANQMVPENFMVSWDEDFDFSTINLDQEEPPEGAFYYALEEDSLTFNVITAFDFQGSDTLGLAFNIFADEIEEKRYEFANADLLEQILGALFGEEIDPELIPEGTVLPIFDLPGEFGEYVTIFSLFAPSNYTNSYLEITEIDRENNTVSGEFVMNWSYTSENENTGEEEEIKILSISDGVFNKVPMIR